MNKGFSLDRNSFQEILASAFLVQQSELDKGLLNSVAELERLMETDHFSVETIADLPLEESPKVPITEGYSSTSSPYRSPAADEIESPPPAESVSNNALPRPTDSWTSPLTVLVIVLVLILGWMLGRITWRSAQPRPTPAIPAHSKDGVDSRAENRQDEVTAPPQPLPKKENFTMTSDSLVIYQNGRVIFRTDQASGSPRPESGDGKAERSSSELPMARVAHQVTPEYPELAKQRHIEGPVVLEAVIGENGEVQKLDVISGAPILADAASAAVRKWRFRLPRIGSSGASVLRITVNFRLR